MNKSRIRRIIFLVMALLLAFPMAIAPVVGISGATQAKNGVLTKPDLVIASVSPVEVKGGYQVTYTVKNQGKATAATGHYASLTVDGRVKEYQRVGSTGGIRDKGLSAGATWTGTFDEVIECSGKSDSIQVCADYKNVVEESDERNNCRTVTYMCPIEPEELPDLVITKVSPVEVKGGYQVTYTVKNQGKATAAAGHYASLTIDSKTREYQAAGAGGIRDKGLSAGATWTGTFDEVMECSGKSDSIQVCADYKNVVEESDERNNCRTTTYTCPVAESKVKPDLVITELEAQAVTGGYHVSYIVKNQGTDVASAYYIALYVDSDLITNVWMDAVINPGGSLSSTFDTVIECDEAVLTIQACVDNDFIVDELDETNNCLYCEYEAKIIVDGTNIKAYINDELKLDYTDNDLPLIFGGFCFNAAPDSHVFFDDINVKVGEITQLTSTPTD